MHNESKESQLLLSIVFCKYATLFHSITYVANH
jgi:hypothetical protein